MRHSVFPLSWLNLKIVILVRAAMQRKMRKHPKDHWMHRAGRSFYLFFAIIAAGQRRGRVRSRGAETHLDELR